LSDIEPETFWDRKILRWEADRYLKSADTPSLLEKLANLASDPIRFRAQWAVEILSPHCRNLRVAEIGCGSGHLAAPLMAAGAASYQGYDISSVAIAKAREGAHALGIEGPPVRFDKADTESLPDPLEADIVFSLGLFDWLTEAQIESLYAKVGSALFLHSYSEKRAVPSQWLHRLYVHIAYGHRTNAYVPKYFRREPMAELARRHTDREIRFLTHRRLSFGVFVTNLPAGH